MQHGAEANDQLYMAKIAQSNLELVAAEIAFYAERDTERGKEDEEHHPRIEAEVDDLFDQLGIEGWSDEEEVKSSTGNDHEAGPSGGGGSTSTRMMTTTCTLCVQRSLPRDDLL